MDESKAIGIVGTEVWPPLLSRQPEDVMAQGQSMLWRLEPFKDIKAPAEIDRESEMMEDEQSNAYDSRKAEYRQLQTINNYGVCVMSDLCHLFFC